MKDLLANSIRYSEGITLIFSGIVAISTVVYAILTWRLTSETRKMRRSQTEPKVAVFLQPGRAIMHCLDLIIKNIGSGPAYNVRFEVLEEFDVRGDRKLSQIDFIHEGIDYMPPGYSVETFFLQLMGDLYKEIIDKKIAVKVAYENSIGDALSEIIHLNMSQFKGRQRLGDDPLNTIAQNMEKVERGIDKLSSGRSHLRVDTYTSQDRQRIHLEEQQQLQALKEKQQQAKKDQNC